MCIFVIVLSLILATAKTVEGESRLTVDAPIQTQQLNDHFFSQETAPAFSNGTKVYTNTSGEKERISQYIREVFGRDGESMLAIAKCESGLNPKAINWKDMEITGVGPSQGIFQLNMPYNEQLFDWKYNIDIAYSNFYLKRGIQPWSCAKILGLR